MMYILACYILLLLSPSGYTLLQVWEILYPEIVDANDLIHCNALLKRLQVISMGTVISNNGNAIGPTNTIMNLQVPLADEDLINHRLQIQMLATTKGGTTWPSSAIQILGTCHHLNGGGCHSEYQ